MNIYKLLKQPFFGRFMVDWQSPLSPRQQKDWQPVQVESRSGATIQGLLGRADTQVAKAVIVMGHPMGKEAKGYFIKHGYTDLLRQHGYHTLVFDINGFGESSCGNFNFYEDLLAIGAEATRLVPNLPVGYFGISLGAQWASIAFTDDNHPYRFAILESPPSTLEEFWVKFPFAYAALRTMSFFAPRYARRMKTVERIKEARHLHALLFIYSESDNWTPVSMGERYQKNAPVPAELWVVEQAEHAQIMKSEYRTAYQEKILSFLDKSVSALEKASVHS
jgi:alpha-beta hydrolase superfamily lysophospholipase